MSAKFRIKNYRRDFLELQSVKNFKIFKNCTQACSIFKANVCLYGKWKVKWLDITISLKTTQQFTFSSTVILVKHK